MVANTHYGEEQVPGGVPSLPGGRVNEMRSRSRPLTHTAMTYRNVTFIYSAETFMWFPVPSQRQQGVQILPTVPLLSQV